MVEIEIIQTRAQKAIAIRCKVKENEIPQAMGMMFAELVPLLGSRVMCTGPPFTLYHAWSDDEVDMDVGFPVEGGEVIEGRVRTIELPAVKAAVTTHIGPYDRLVDTYGQLMSWMERNGHHPADIMWEEYLNSPEETPPEQLSTRIYWPIR